MAAIIASTTHDCMHLVTAPRRLVAATLATVATHRGSTTSHDAAAARNAPLISTAVEVTWPGSRSLAATFDGEFSDTTRSYAGKGVARYVW